MLDFRGPLHEMGLAEIVLRGVQLIRHTPYFSIEIIRPSPT